MRLLVVEDDREMSGYLKRGLEDAGYAVDVAADGAEGLHLAVSDRYSLVVLDLMLPVRGAGDEFDALARTLNQMLERLEDSVQRLNQFTADAAHELRSPVARLRMAADLSLSGDEDAATLRAALDDIVRQADDLTSLVNRLLFLAREGTERGAVSMSSVDAAELLAETASTYAVVAEDKGLTLVSATVDVGHVRGDRQRLLRAIGNLVENAIQHTPAGGTVTLAGSISGTTYTFTVADTGRGIAAADLPHIFDRFYRADASRHSGGAGLGLSIVQAIARSHDGTVAAESEAGGGATFRLSIPLAS